MVELIVALLLMLLLVDVHQRFVQKHRCSYCGVVGGHEAHCPWNVLNRG